VPSGSLARRYADAIFALAEEANDLDGWRQELTKLDELLNDEIVRAAFRSPTVSTARRLALALRLAPELRPETQNLLRLLVERRRTRAMPDIRQAFERKADEAAGIVHVTMTTAVALSEGQQEAYRQALARKLGRDVRLAAAVNPTLIGGATIQIGDHQVDGSMRARLNRLRESLLD